MSATYRGYTSREGEADAEGYRTYKVNHLVETDDPNDGPAVVMQTAGLPLPGAVWFFGNDLDVYCWCRSTMRVKAYSEVGKKGDKPKQWDVEQTFSNKPVPQEQQRCNLTTIQDPLLEPPKVSGSFTVYTEQGGQDRFGNLILSSSWEPLTGPENEWDAVRFSVDVEQNVPTLDLPFLYQVGNSPLNSQPIWGLPIRSVKCVPVGWERKYYGVCYVYYTRKFQFQVRIKLDPRTGDVVGDWDRDLRDVGTLYLGGPNARYDPVTGNWDPGLMEDGSTPDRFDPRCFTRAKDRIGNLLQVGVLDGRGQPAGGEETQGDTGPWLIRVSVDAFPGDTYLPNVWVLLTGDPSATPKAWVATLKYTRGALRRYAGTDYLCINPTGSTVGSNPSVDTTNWTTAITRTNKGYYDQTLFNTYGVGDYVSLGSTTYYGPGIIHVEKYSESNFLLLNLPIDL